MVRQSWDGNGKLLLQLLGHRNEAPDQCSAPLLTAPSLTSPVVFILSCPENFAVMFQNHYLYLGYVSSIFVLSINRLTNRTASFLLPVSGKGGLRDQKTNGKKPWSSFTVQEAVRSSGCPRGTEIHHMLAETCNARENWEILPVHSSVRMKRHKGGSCLRMNAEVVRILQQVFTNTPTKPQVRIIM